MEQRYHAFTNGEITEYVSWKDTEGNEINASDGGMIYVDGVYHWYGQKLRALPFAPKGKGGQVTTEGVVMYRSEDLYNWTYEGVILPCSKDPNSPLYGPMRFERPKIIYNERTKKYVLWCHYVAYPGDHGDEPGTGEAGIASCDTVNGTYEWHGTTRPIDDLGSVKDSTLYKDRDGKAYFIYDRKVGDDRCTHIVELSEDYLSCTDHYRRVQEACWREAATPMYHDGWYFIFTSGLTSWKANPAKYYRAKSLMGPWTEMGDPYEGDVTGTSFESQSTYVFPVEGKPGLFIHMAERHNTENFERCSYIWTPVEFPTKDSVVLRHQKTWQWETFGEQYV